MTEKKIKIELTDGHEIRLQGESAENFLTAWTAYMSGTDPDIKGTLIDYDDWNEGEKLWVCFHYVKTVLDYSEGCE